MEYYYVCKVHVLFNAAEICFLSDVLCWWTVENEVLRPSSVSSVFKKMRKKKKKSHCDWKMSQPMSDTARIQTQIWLMEKAILITRKEHKDTSSNHALAKALEKLRKRR